MGYVFNPFTGNLDAVGTGTVGPPGPTTNVYTEELAGTQSGSDVLLDLTGLAHPYDSVLLVVRIGQVLTPVTEWSQSGDIITIPDADASSAFLVQYINQP